MGLDYQVITAAMAPDRLDINPVLERLHDGDPTPFAYAQVVRIVESADSTPSTAEVVIRNVNGADDEQTLVTLQSTGLLSPANLPAGTRVRIIADNQTLFIGELVQREEMGTAGALKLTFEDDRRLMWRMPVWGCLVAETGNQTNPPFVPRLPFRLNPAGLGNCRLVSITGAPWKVPVFTHVAYASAALDAAAGYPTFWTPEYLIKHLWYRLYTWSGGTGDDPYAHVPRMGTKFSWDPQSCTFAASEMHQKLPDLSFNGWMAAGILDKVCDICGAYGWRTVPWNVQNAIEFFRRTQVDYTNEPEEPPIDAQPIYLQRAGTATDSNTAYDFHVSDDYRKTVTQLTVDGAPPEIEAVFSMASGVETLEYVHTAAEFSAFKAIINGNGTNAVVNGQVVSDVLANTRAAYELAKAEYPMVGAIRLKDGANLDTILYGYDGEFADKYGLDTLAISRPIAEELLTRIGDSDARYGVRVQVDDTNDGNGWHTVQTDPGLKCRGDGTIVLSGLMADEAGNDALYNYLMAHETDSVTFKDVRICAVIQHDARTTSTIGVRSSGTFVGRQADPNGIAAELDPTWLAQSTGPAEYILASERDPDMTREDDDGAFRIQHRMDSIYSDGVSATSDAYRDDQTDLDKHADRRFKDKARVGRAQQWKMIGIRSDYRVGMFIGNMVERGGTLTGVRAINAPLIRVVWQFDGPQHTELVCDGF
jgi:hypothetical protein